MKGVIVAVWAAVGVAAAFRLPHLFDALGKHDVKEGNPSRYAAAFEAAMAATGKEYYLVSGFNSVAVTNRMSPSLWFADKRVAVVVTGDDMVFVRDGPAIPCNETSGSGVVDPQLKSYGRFWNMFRPRQLVMVRNWCSPGATDMAFLGTSAISTNEAWNSATDEATKALAIADSITIPLALLVFGVVIRSYRVVALPVLSAAMTSIVSMALLSMVSDSIPATALNIQSALALALSIDYSMFLVQSSRGAHTVLVSGLILFGSSLSTLIIPSVHVHIVGLASSIAIFVALAVNLTLINALRPAKKEVTIYETDNDTNDDELIEEGEEPAPAKLPFVARHPLAIVGCAAVLVVVSACLCTKIELCGGVYCMAAKGAKLSELEALPGDPEPTSVLVLPGADLSHCARKDMQRQYTVGTGTFMDVMTPLQHTAEYMRRIEDLDTCIGSDGYIVNRAMVEYYLMKKTIRGFASTSVLTLSIVFVVMAVTYGAPVIALKAVVTVVSTFVTACAVMGLVFGWAVCWIVPVLTMPLVVGIGMDFHVFYLDGLASRTTEAIINASNQTRRITNGAGIILTVAFVGLLAVPIRLVEQTAVFLITAVVMDTALIRPLVVPAAMLLLGRYNWACASRKD